MAVKEILLLGNPQLYEISEPMLQSEFAMIANVVPDLHYTLLDYRKRYGAGRAIAAPQIAVKKRVIYLHIKEPVILINPQLDLKSEEQIELWDDCLSLPGLLVKVKRHKNCRIGYRDMEWNKKEMFLEDDLSELLQHEYDHLDGVLAVGRAIDGKSIAFQSQREYLS